MATAAELAPAADAWTPVARDRPPRQAHAAARAIIDAGADGVLIEVHHDPDKALCDGPQSLYPDQFAA